MDEWGRWLLAGIALVTVGEPHAEEFVGSWREYGVIGSALVGAAIVERWPPNQDHPLIGGRQKPYIERERVPDWTLGVAHVAAFAAIRFGPGGKDRVRHAHGYVMAAALTQFGTSLVKGIVGRRRPNYEAARALGESTRSKSFYSGHASSAFCLATYSSLYTWRRAEKPLYRVGVPLILYGAATYTAWTRVAEHRHYPSDVIAGAIAGGVVAAGVYRWYDGMDGTAGSMTLAPASSGLALAIRF